MDGFPTLLPSTCHGLIITGEINDKAHCVNLGCSFRVKFDETTDYFRPSFQGITVLNLVGDVGDELWRIGNYLRRGHWSHNCHVAGIGNGVFCARVCFAQNQQK